MCEREREKVDMIDRFPNSRTLILRSKKGERMGRVVHNLKMMGKVMMLGGEGN